MHTNQHSRLIKRKVKRKKHRFIASVVIITLLLGGIGLFIAEILNQAAGTVSNSYEDDGRENGSDLRDKTIATSEDNFSILLIGVDNGGSRPTEDTNGLSDALIFATFNKKEHSVKLLSIPRDSYVYLPLRDEYTKINHAHSYDGTKGSILAVENLLDIPIDYYAKVNFDAFIDVVDTLGGIKFDVPYEMSEIDSNDNQHAINLMPGEQMLNGEEALAVARTRRYDNDIERGKRQQEILKAIFDRALSVNAILNFNNLLDAVGKNMKTDMTFGDIKNLSTYLLDGDFKIETLSLKGTDMITDLYYYQLDEEHLSAVIEELKAHLEL